MRTISVQDAAEILAARTNIVAAWVFGSAQSGEARDGADLDIGVLFETKPDLDELASLRADLQTALHFDQIDLVVLNDASSVLRFEAASGRRVHCRDAGRCAEFVSLAAREYEDDMAMVERCLKHRPAAGPPKDATPGSEP